MRSLVCALLLFTLAPLSSFAAEKSIAREWNEVLLQAIRRDYARPTVTARNLFHFSIALYDSWAIYDSTKDNFYINFKKTAPDVAKARRETMSYAAYRLILQRFQKAPKHDDIVARAKALMQQLSLDPEYVDLRAETPAAYGNLIAEMVLQRYQFDGAREEQDYETPFDDYPFINPPMIVKLPGVGSIVDINLWQPLALSSFIDQGGNPIPASVVRPLTLHWGRLPPFAMTEADKSARGLYLDPGAPPEWGGAGHDDYVAAMEQVIEYSSWLDPRDGVRMDISPRSLGNNSLGKNDGHGREVNPITGKSYRAQVVPRGDFARVLAEFWADGPASETPPGHWNVVANDVADRMTSFKWMGRGREMDRLEWEVKLYLTLNGALYDASIAAWGLKGYYQGSRPISAIRYMAELGQSSNPSLPHYHPKGLHLRPGLIEFITPELTAPGEKFAHLVGYEGEIAIRSWLGAPANPDSEFNGVGWILAKNWLPYQRPTFVTPPFPGYVSGHSTYSRAGAEVLTAVTGSKFFPNGMGEYVAPKDQYLVFEDGPSETVKLQWATYYDAADQSALSRIFGGIHGFIDDFPGRRIGSVVGRKAVAKANTIFKEPLQ